MLLELITVGRGRRSGRRLRLVAAALVASAASTATAADATTTVRYRVRSHFVHRTLPQTAVIPAGGAEGRPLLVFLHGRGRRGNEANANGSFSAALRALGSRAPHVVFPNGGDHSYFHARRSGDWARYVLDEVIPRAVERLGADPRRVAIGGISMHSGAYWHRHYKRYLRFYADALAAC